MPLTALNAPPLNIILLWSFRDSNHFPSIPSHLLDASEHCSCLATSLCELSNEFQPSAVKRLTRSPSFPLQEQLTRHQHLAHYLRFQRDHQGPHPLTFNNANHAALTFLHRPAIQLRNCFVSHHRTFINKQPQTLPTSPPLHAHSEPSEHAAHC